MKEKEQERRTPRFFNLSNCLCGGDTIHSSGKENGFAGEGEGREAGQFGAGWFQGAWVTPRWACLEGRGVPYGFRK